VTVTAYDGTLLVPSTDATGTGGAYTYRLSATATAKLDKLTLSWVVTVDGTPETFTTDVEVIGASLFTIAEARAFDQKQLANVTNYPDARIEEARGRVLDSFQDICGSGFVPRYTESFIRHDGGFSAGDYGGYYRWNPVDRPEIMLPFPYPRLIRQLSVSHWAQDWTDWDLTANPVELTDTGMIRGNFPHGYLRIRYEHGLDAPPAAIKKAALEVLLFDLIPSNLPQRATSYDVAGTTYRLSTADSIRRFYGIPTVDSVLSRYAFVTIG
jgi:hypothetical protein